jgi:hypothetical protein
VVFVSRHYIVAVESNIGSKMLHGQYAVLAALWAVREKTWGVEKVGSYRAAENLSSIAKRTAGRFGPGAWKKNQVFVRKKLYSQRKNTHFLAEERLDRLAAAQNGFLGVSNFWLGRKKLVPPPWAAVQRQSGCAPLLLETGGSSSSNWESPTRGATDFAFLLRWTFFPPPSVSSLTT